MTRPIKKTPQKRKRKNECNYVMNVGLLIAFPNTLVFQIYIKLFIVVICSSLFQYKYVCLCVDLA